MLIVMKGKRNQEKYFYDLFKCIYLRIEHVCTVLYFKRMQTCAIYLYTFKFIKPIDTKFPCSRCVCICIFETS
jgi:hypothetical protein